MLFLDNKGAEGLPRRQEGRVGPAIRRSSWGMSCDIELPSAGLPPRHGLRVQRTGLQWAPRGKEPWRGRERRKVAPAAGAKFIGSVPPITLISHRFECQTRRFFAILRGGPVRYGEGTGAGGIDGAVTAQRIGRSDNALAGGRGQGVGLGRFFCFILFNDTH